MCVCVRVIHSFNAMAGCVRDKKRAGLAEFVSVCVCVSIGNRHCIGACMIFIHKWRYPSPNLQLPRQCSQPMFFASVLCQCSLPMFVASVQTHMLLVASMVGERRPQGRIRAAFGDGRARLNCVVSFYF